MIPVGHDQPLRGVPWLTLSLLALCTVCEILRFVRLPSPDTWQRATYERALAEVAAIAAVEHPEQPPLDRRAAAVRLAKEEAVVAAEASGGSAEAGPADVRIPYRLARIRRGELGNPAHPALRALRATDEEIRRLERRDLAVVAAFRPAQGWDGRALFYALVAPGWWDLAVTLLLLWLLGAGLEDRWGAAAVGTLWVAGTLGGAVGFWALAPHETAGLSGAQPAVAALMGAFVWVAGDARVRLLTMRWWPRPGLAVVRLRARLAVPLWLLAEAALLLRQRGSAPTAAQATPLIGFAVGLALAAIARYSGIERRWLLPAVARAVGGWHESPAFIAALDHLGAGRREDAFRVLSALLERQPHHADARRRWVDLALELNRTGALAAHASAALMHETPASARVALYERLDSAVPPIRLSDRALFDVVRAAGESRRTALADAVARRLLHDHVASPLAPAALRAAADAQREAGAAEPAAALEALLAERFPDDPLAAPPSSSR